MNIYIGEPIIISDMQGPCPDGFHVPTDTDWQGIIDIFTTLGINTVVDFQTYLKLLWNGGRSYDTSPLGGDAKYWTCIRTGNYGKMMSFNTSISVGIVTMSAGILIRAFRNVPVTPDGSWTALYSDKIYHNSTLGLISISGDGNTRYTIADKNVGATTVWNYGDTVNDNNGGGLFQRGNNYMWQGLNVAPSPTSSRKVNASTYGPGNYYNNSTRITALPRDNSGNLNLRGGVSQGTSTKSVEVQNIYIGEYTPNFATQGPAPDGFHVPLITEWSGLKTIMDGMSMTENGWKENLHLPFAGYRYYYDSNVMNQGYSGLYWSSSPGSSLTSSPHLQIQSGYIDTSGNMPHSSGYSIRAFKNSFEAPTSSWTVVSGTLGSAGIFRNQTDGLISITSDGNTGYTIQDKNVGATTVYSNGDTLSEANCGKYYQWGNNYGFAWTGSITTSTTQVDASNYGPGNYYSSSTFIYRNTSPYNWDSSNNQNLRGGEDGNVPVE